MFNPEILDTLLKSSGRSEREFLAAVFGKQAKRGMNYFRKVSDVQFTTAEKVADFFAVPLDCLRTSPHMNSGVAIGNHNQVGNISVNSNFMAEIQYLRQMVTAKDETIASNKLLLESKDELIANLKKRLDDALAMQVGRLK